MSKDIRTRLAADKTVALWRDLATHAHRGRVFVLRGALELIDVGESLVANDTRRVEAWLANGQLSRPTLSEIEEWDRLPGKFFDMLIVEPWVLIQPAKLPAEETVKPENTTIEELAKFAAERQDEN